MRYRLLTPLGRDVSTLALGTALYREAGPDVSFELLDEWRALGGNLLDTAREYGEAESVLGRWLATRGCRDEMIVATKAGHFHDDGEELRRRVAPEPIAADLGDSLAALGTDYVDLLVLHRDDPSQSVGPLIEFLNELKKAGQILAFGASNWTIDRLEAANRHAAVHGLDGFSLSSTQLSLAVWNAPPWWEVVSGHDPPTLAWQEGTQLPLFAWSAQASGFFSGVHNPDLDVLATYASPGNRERLRRAAELGERKGVGANEIALAWVLHQPFPTYAIIGPRAAGELRSSVAALELELTRAEVRWLDLEEDAWENET